MLIRRTISWACPLSERYAGWVKREKKMAQQRTSLCVAYEIIETKQMCATTLTLRVWWLGLFLCIRKREGKKPLLQQCLTVKAGRSWWSALKWMVLTSVCATVKLTTGHAAECRSQRTSDVFSLCQACGGANRVVSVSCNLVICVRLPK